MSKALNKLRYIVYVRKSEERKERQELSHQSQIEEIKKSFPDLNIVKWLEPESKSAFTPGRPIFEEALSMIDKGEADGIISWHPNRLSRNEIDSARLTYALRSTLKDLKFCSYSFDNSAEGIMMLQMVMNQSQYESSKQGRDVKRGMNQKASNGERPGQVPQGYIKIPVLDENGALIKTKDKIVTLTGRDSERFDQIKKMWEMLVSGEYTAPQIRKIANEDWGFLTRKTSKLGGVPLAHSMMYAIFNNPFYAGLIPHNGEYFQGCHEPMITVDQFDRAQFLMKSRGKHRTGVHPYSYAGLIKCGVCDCSIVGKTNVKFVKRDQREKVYVHYYCTRRSELRSCNQNVYTSLDKLESQIVKELSSYTILPEFKDLALEILNRDSKIEEKSRNKTYKALTGQRESVQNQLDNLVDMRTKDLLTDEEYTDQKVRLTGERSKIDELLRSTERRVDNWITMIEGVFDFATHAQDRFVNGTLEDKRQVLMNLGTNLTLKDGVLSLEPNEWMIPLKESYPELEKQYLNVRTNKKSTLTLGDVELGQIIETWRARRDSNPRHSA